MAMDAKSIQLQIVLVMNVVYQVLVYQKEPVLEAIFVPLVHGYLIVVMGFVTVGRQFLHVIKIATIPPINQLTPHQQMEQ